MTYKRQPEVIHQCQVFIDLKGTRCTRKALYHNGKTAMCEQHNAKYMEVREQERLRLKDKYAEERHEQR